MEDKKIIGNLHCEIIMNVKLSLWSAIKLRIAGIKNVFDRGEINTGVNSDTGEGNE